MDPNETLKIFRARYAAFLESDEEDGTACVEAAEAAANLDAWLTKGGFLPKEWMDNGGGGFLRRAALAHAVYLAWENSFEGGKVAGAGPTHVAVGNLLGALLKGETFVLARHPPSMREEFEGLFAPEHPVWQHVVREEGQ